MAHARAAFALHARQEDGSTLRDTLLERSRRRDAGAEAARAQLSVPPIPVGFGYLLDDFNALHKRRAFGPAGPLPLSWESIDAWARRTGKTPTAWELRVIDLLDDAYFAAQSPEAVRAPREHQAWPDKSPQRFV